MNPQSEHIVVLGGAGFVGSHLVERLIKEGHTVSVLDNLSSGRLENLEQVLDSPSFFFSKTELHESFWSGMHRVTENGGAVDRIVLLAAQISVPYSVSNPNFDTRVNYNTTWEVLEYARIHRVKKVVFSSSSAVYGDAKTLPIEEEMPKQPLSPYGINKYSSEMALRCYWNVHAVPCATLRFFNVFGPRQDPRSGYSGVISIFIDRALAELPLLIFGDGLQTRDFVYVGDVVDALFRALFGSIRDGSACNVCTGRAVTVLELAEIIKAKAGSTSSIEHREVRKGDILHSCASYRKAQKELGFAPKTTLEEGLKETVRWCRSLRE